MRPIPLLLVACALASGCPAHRPPPERAFSEIQRAAADRDVARFRGHLSSETLTYLRQQFGEEKVDPAAEFMMGRLAAKGPYRVVEQRRDGAKAVLAVTGKDSKEELTFVWQRGAWRLDLVESYRAWVRLAEDASEVGRRMREAAPLLGEGLGAKLLRVPEKW